jgi:aminopeptidase N
VRRARLAVLLAAAAGLVPATAPADTYPRQEGVDVVHYAFRLTLADDTNEIDGEAAVELAVRADGLATVELDLAPTMTVSGVRSGGAALSFERPGDRLRVRLEPPGRAGETREIVVRYRGKPASGLLIADNRYGERTFFSDNWPDKARQWLPVVDHPYDKATSEFVVTAPAHYQVVSNGRLVEETDDGGGRRVTHWRSSVPIAPWLYCLGVARFAVEHRPEWRGLPIDTWVYRQDRDLGFSVFAEPTTAALDFFADRIGPYSYERLGQVVANGVRGGMESASSIFYGDESVREKQTRRWRDVIVHEIAHQWWGNAVTEADWDDVWLSEGFATYFTHLFVEHACGRDEMIAGLVADRDAIRAFDRENPGYRVIHDDLADMTKVVTGPGTYKKGAWTLHMLRGVVGDAAFWEGIRTYYGEHRNGNARTADLRRAMERAAGRDLGWFFDEWLTRGGMLKVRAGWSWDAGAKAVKLEVEQTQPGPPYRMPVEVALRPAGGAAPRLATVDLTEAKQAFTLPAEAAPDDVVLDPRTMVLMDAEVTAARGGPGRASRGRTR